MDRFVSWFRDHPDLGHIAMAMVFPIAASVFYIYLSVDDSPVPSLSNNIIPSRLKSKADFNRKYVVFEEAASQKGAVTEKVNHGSWSALGLERPLVIAMVGLPARGKSYIVKMLIRYLTWISFETEVFNVGSYRRRIGLAGADSNFFNPTNKDASRLREDMAAHVQDEMYVWLKSGGQRRRVAIFDATNTTKERRFAVCHRARQENVQLLYVESICDDQEVLNANYELKLQNADYIGMDPDQARADFMSRVKAYEKVYESIEDDEDDGHISYIKLINVGQKTITRGCSGYLPSQVAFYLQNVHIQPRKIYFSLPAATSGAVDESGIEQLTEKGRQYVLDFANYFDSRRVMSPASHGDEHIILCGTGSAAMATIAHLHRIVPCYSTVLLNNKRKGDFEGMSTEEINMKFPDEEVRRKADPWNYRCPGGGESYTDVVERTRPIVVELERQRKNVIVISGYAVLRCLLAYFMGTESSEIPKLRFKPHHIYEMIPGPFGCTIREMNPVLE